jgi:transcriptional regulator with XRE-family HTH domain
MPKANRKPDYGRAIRIVRAARGLSTTELANRTGISASQLSLVQTGKRQTSLSKLHRIAKALQISDVMVAVLASPDGCDGLDALALLYNLTDSKLEG